MAQGNSSQSGDLRFNATLQDNVSPQVDKIVQKMQQLGASKHEIKIFIRAYDEATQRATQVKQHLASIPKEIRTQITVDAAQAHRAINEIKKLAAEPIHVAIKLKDATEQDIVKARNYFNRIKQEAVTSFQQMPALGDAMKLTHTMGNMGLSVAGLGGAGLVAGGAAFARQSFQQNAQLEQDTIALKATLKNMGEAMQEMSNVTQFARKTPFNQPDVLQSDIMMRNFGINPKGPAGLTTAGNMAAAFGRSQQDATLAIADASKRGDFRMMSGFGINMQQSDFGPGGRYQGMSVQQAIGLTTQQRFGSAMQEQAKTFRGLSSNIQDVANISFIRPSGTTGFGAVKSMEQKIEGNLTGQGPSAIQFQKEMGKVVQSINDMSSKMLTTFKNAAGYFKTYIETPLKAVSSNLMEFGSVFAQTFGGTAVTILKTFANAFTAVAKPMSEVANWQVPSWIPAIGGLNAAKIEAFGKALHYMGFQKTAQPFEDFPKDLATLHPFKAMGDIFKMGAQAPKLLLLNMAKNILEDKAATDALNDSFDHFGKGAGDALDNVKLKLDALSLATGKKASALRGLGAEVANILPSHTPGITDVVARGVSDIQGAQDKYGTNIKGLIEKQVQQWAQTQDITGKDWDKATANATQAANSVADALGVNLKSAVDDLTNSFNVFSKQIGESKGAYARNPVAAASVLTQMQGLIHPSDITSKLISGKTILGTVQNPQQLAAAIYEQGVHPTIRGIQHLYKSDPGYSVTSTGTFRKDFDQWNGPFTGEHAAQPSPGMRVRNEFLDATRTEQTRVNQLNAYDRRASRATGGLDIQLPHPENQFFKYDVGIHPDRMKTPDSMAKEMIRFQDVIKKVQQASEDAQTAFATLQVAQQHLSQAQTEVNFQFENFQHVITVKYQRAIENITLSMNQFSFNALRPLQREMTRLQNTMEVYQHTAIVPVQRAQEDWNHVMTQTSYHLDDVNYKMSQASYQMDKYGSGLVTGEQALNDQIHALDIYQKQLDLLKLSNQGMMSDLTKTTFTEGFKMTVKPMMGFSLEREARVAAIKAQKAQDEKAIGPDNAHYLIGLAERSKFQRTERSPEEILKHVTAARKILDEGVESTHKLSIIQHAQSVHARIFTEEMYNATRGMRKFEDEQYNLNQKMFPVNEKLADMQDNITKLGLAMEKRSHHARVYQDALDKLRHSSYHLGRDLYEAEQRMNQLDALLPIARGQQGMIYEHFLKGLTDFKFDQLKELIKELGKAGDLSPGIVKSYEGMKDPLKAASEKMKSDIHKAFNSGLSGFLGLFTGRTELLLGHLAGDLTQKLTRSLGVTLPDFITNTLNTATTAFTALWTANAVRIAATKSVGWSISTLGKTGEGRVAEGIDKFGNMVGSTAPGRTLFRPSSYLTSKAVELPFNIAGMAAFGPAGYPLGSIPGWMYENAAPGRLTGRMARRFGVPHFGEPGRIDRVLAPRLGYETTDEGLKQMMKEHPAYRRLVNTGILEGPHSVALEKLVTKLEKVHEGIVNIAANPKLRMGDRTFEALEKSADRVAARIDTLKEKIKTLTTGEGGATSEWWSKFKGESGALDVAELGPLSRVLPRGLSLSKIKSLARIANKVALPIAAVLSAKSGVDAAGKGVGLAGSELAYAEGLDPTSLLSLIPGLHNFHGVVGAAGRAVGIDTRTGAEKFIGAKVEPYLKNLQRNLTRLGSQTVDEDTGKVLTAQDRNRRQQAEVGTLLTRISYAEKQKGYHGQLDEAKKQLTELSNNLDTAYGNMQASAAAFHRQQHHAHKVYAQGLADIESGIRTHNVKQTEKGYKEVAHITGMKLKDIKTMVKHMGDETGKEYAHALNLAIGRVINGPPGKESDLLGSTAQSKALMKHLRGTAPFGDGNAYLAEINRLFPPDKKDKDPASTPKLSDKFKAIEDSTDSHLKKMKDFYSTFQDDRKKSDKDYWEGIFTRRTDGMNLENTDLDRHGSNVFKKVDTVYNAHSGTVPKKYFEGWDHINTITSTFLKKVDKRVHGIESEVSDPPGHAHGGVVDGKNIKKGHLVRVGEEGYPEVIIPLAPHRRDRAMALMKQAHGYLGLHKNTHENIPQFAIGGIPSAVTAHGNAPLLAQGYRSGGPGIMYAGSGFNAVNAFTKKKFNLPLTTGMIDHNIDTVFGNVSDHSKGLAGDFSDGNDTPAERAMWNFFSRKVPQVVKQMIHWHKTFSGGHTGNYPLDDHFNHVHLAMHPQFAFQPRKIATILARASRGISFEDLLTGDGSLNKVPQSLLHGHGNAGVHMYKGLVKFRRHLQHNLDSNFGLDSSTFTGPSTGGSLKDNEKLAQQMAAAMGWTGSEWTALRNIWSRESGFDPTIHYGGGHGYVDGLAYGIPQSLPGSKMASAGADWKTSPATQIKWGLNYIKGRYGDPLDAWKYWQANSSYAGGGFSNPFNKVLEAAWNYTVDKTKGAVPEVVSLGGDGNLFPIIDQNVSNNNLGEVNWNKNKTVVSFNPLLENWLFDKPGKTGSVLYSRLDQVKNSISTILHEFAHARQGKDVTENPDRAYREGGATAWARGHLKDFARQVTGSSKAKNLPDNYNEWADWLIKNKGQSWVDKEQFSRAGGGFAGWFGSGGAFTANRPTLVGVGERGPEHVSITPAGSSNYLAVIAANTTNIWGHQRDWYHKWVESTSHPSKRAVRAAVWSTTKLGTDLFKDEQAHLGQMHLPEVGWGRRSLLPWQKNNPWYKTPKGVTDYTNYKIDAMSRGVPLETINAVIKAAKTPSFDTLTSDKQVPAKLGILANVLNRATSPHLVGGHGFKTKYEDRPGYTSNRIDPSKVFDLRAQRGVHHDSPEAKAARETTKAVNRNTQEVRRNRPYAPSRASQGVLAQAKKDAAQAAKDSKLLQAAARQANVDLAKLTKWSAISHTDKTALNVLLTSGNLTAKETKDATKALQLTNKAIREEAKARHDTLKALHLVNIAEHATLKASHELHRGAALIRKANHDLHNAQLKAALDGHVTAKEHKLISALHKKVHEGHVLLHKGHVDETRAHHLTTKALHATTESHKEVTKAVKDATDAHHATTKVIREVSDRIHGRTSETRDAVISHHGTHKNIHIPLHMNHRDITRSHYELDMATRQGTINSTLQAAAGYTSAGAPGSGLTDAQRMDQLAIAARLQQSAALVASGGTALPGTPGGRALTAAEMQWIAAATAGHAGGLTYVPYDNYKAKLHIGERVLTKQEATNYNYRPMGVSTNKMESLLSMVVGQLQDLKQSQGDIQVINNAQGASLQTNVLRLPSRTR